LILRARFRRIFSRAILCLYFLIGSGGRNRSEELSIRGGWKFSSEIFRAFLGLGSCLPAATSTRAHHLVRLLPPPPSAESPVESSGPVQTDIYLCGNRGSILPAQPSSQGDKRDSRILTLVVASLYSSPVASVSYRGAVYSSSISAEGSRQSLDLTEQGVVFSSLSTEEPLHAT